MIADRAAVRFAASSETGSMPASFISRPSARRKLRASRMAATRPSPCTSNAQGAAIAALTAASDVSAATRAARIRRMAPGLYANGMGQAETIRNRAEGGDDGDQRHCAYLSDRGEFRALAQFLSQAAAASRAEAGDRFRPDLLLRRRAHGRGKSRALAGQ